jgi:hypothetical protein
MSCQRVKKNSDRNEARIEYYEGLGDRLVDFHSEGSRKLMVAENSDIQLRRIEGYWDPITSCPLDDFADDIGLKVIQRIERDFSISISPRAVERRA